VKVGDLVKYYGHWTDIGVVLYVNGAGGTIKVHSNNKTAWWVTSGCEVVSDVRRFSEG
jgi:hypothetical protein